jgi:hypothetical protein
MKTKWKILLLTAGLSAALQGRADDDAIADYRNLTTDNLPHIQAVIQEAINRSATGQLDAMKLRKKLRISYLLPEISMRYGQTEYSQSEYGVIDEIESRDYYDDLTPTGNYDATTQTSARLGEEAKWQPYWNVYAQWDLNKLVFSREETYSRYVKEQQAYYQQKLVKEVISLYTELSGLLAQRGSDVDIMLELDITVAAAKLDFLTGDYLSSMVPAPTPVAPEVVEEPAPAAVEIDVDAEMGGGGPAPADDSGSQDVAQILDALGNNAQ